MRRKFTCTLTELAFLGTAFVLADPVAAQTAGTAFYSLHGQLQKGVVEHFPIALDRPVSSAESLRFQTFGGPGVGGTNAAGGIHAVWLVRVHHSYVVGRRVSRPGFWTGGSNWVVGFQHFA
jgi:hypothetical protein